MFKNYITIAIRNLLIQKGFSFINIVGLAVGIAICIQILLYVQNEYSYDRFNEKADRIGRIVLEGFFGNSEFEIIASPAPMAETLVRDYPEVEYATRIRNFGYPVLRYGEKVFSEEKFFSADSSIFDVFTIPFVAGDKSSALKHPNTLVLTEKMAKKYFGNEDPIGKTLNSDNRNNYEVVGVVKEMPPNSHFHFDFLLSLASNADSRNTMWLSNNYFTYFVIKEGASFKELEKKMEKDLVKYIAPQVQQATGSSWEELMAAGTRYQYFIQPLTDIHLFSKYRGDIEPQSNATYVYIFSIIAIGILLIACINFMNLSTARSAGRAKEVGVRKTMGSSMGQLMRQFLSESVIMSIIAVIIAAILVKLLLPFFNDISGKTLAIEYFTNIIIIPSLLIFAICVGLFSGSYPAVFLSSFDPVKVLGGKYKAGSKGKFLRSGLVILQFTISIVLFVGTFIIKDQLDYIQNKNLGYNKEQLIVIHKSDDIGSSISSFRESLRQNPSVRSASNSTSLPGYPDFYANAYKSQEAPSEAIQVINDMYADYNFADVFQLELVAGRYYSEDRAIDTTNTIVLNESAVAAFELKDPIGSQIVRMGNNPETSPVFTVIGVVKDFHYESLHKKIDPLVLNLLRGNGFGRYTTVSLKTSNIQSNIKELENIWATYAGNQAFDYTFYDDDFAKIYNSEARMGTLFTTFSVLAILIACLGLLGLATFTTEQRTKEIGIRKALGAKVSTIIFLLSKEFAKWIIISNIIAWPVSYYLMNSWLQDFEYRTEIGVLTFIISGILSLLIALLSISSQSIKAAIANPVKALKYE